MRVRRWWLRTGVLCAGTALVLAGCSNPQDEGELTAAPVEDSGGGDEGSAGPADWADDGGEDAAAQGDEAGAGERPEIDLELAEEQRQEYRIGSGLESTGTIGSTLDRIGDLETRYDATETEEAETRLTVPDDVLFDFDSDELRPEADDVLAEIAEIIASYDEAVVEIVGHTDDIGAARYNQDLSERRADAVIAHLVGEAGVDGNRVSSRGVGASEPIAPNANADGSDNPEGRAANRRVEVNIDS